MIGDRILAVLPSEDLYDFGCPPDFVTFEKSGLDIGTVIARNRWLATLRPSLASVVSNPASISAICSDVPRTADVTAPAPTLCTLSVLTTCDHSSYLSVPYHVEAQYPMSEVTVEMYSCLTCFGA